MSVDLRNILNAEAAANDGLAFPFLSLAMYLTLDSTPREAISDWIVYGCLCEISSIPCTDSLMSSSKDQVIMGTVIGALLGIFHFK